MNNYIYLMIIRRLFSSRLFFFYSMLFKIKSQNNHNEKYEWKTTKNNKTNRHSFYFIHDLIWTRDISLTINGELFIGFITNRDIISNCVMFYFFFQLSWQFFIEFYSGRFSILKFIWKKMIIKWNKMSWFFFRLFLIRFGFFPFFLFFLSAPFFFKIVQRRSFE